MMKEELQILKDFDNDTALQLIDSAYQYLLDKNSLPLQKLTFNVRVPFSAIYAFLRRSPAKQIAKLETLQLSKEVKQALKEKLYLMYAQNYQKVGLLANYKLECMNPKAVEVQSESDFVHVVTLSKSDCIGVSGGMAVAGLRVVPVEDKRGAFDQPPEQGAAARSSRGAADRPEPEGDHDHQRREVRGAQAPGGLPHKVHAADRVHPLS